MESVANRSHETSDHWSGDTTCSTRGFLVIVSHVASVGGGGGLGVQAQWPLSIILQILQDQQCSYRS